MAASLSLRRNLVRRLYPERPVKINHHTSVSRILLSLFQDLYVGICIIDELDKWIILHLEFIVYYKPSQICSTIHRECTW